ncbi:uncharacterized protein LOC131941837 [Physella acuta]|uniref:uncharacterized protein LOC131941837 n=1 Tax=Physella acuta TaxID=109671 RepID=UPI0027DE5A89|nr:uncharacterized protein LOC131941837 [Physella acuta]
MTGEGKSSTGDTILGYQKLRPVSAEKSGTKEIHVESKQWDHGSINIVDTPGIKDTDAQSITMSNLNGAMRICKEGVNAFVIVIKFKEKWTAKKRKTISTIRECFGKHLIQNCIIVMTHGVHFELQEESLSFDKWCKQQTDPVELVQLFKACHYRTVLFYNKILRADEYIRKQKESIHQLLQMVLHLPGRYIQRSLGISVNDLRVERTPERDGERKLPASKIMASSFHRRDSQNSQKLFQKQDNNFEVSNSFDALRRRSLHSPPVENKNAHLTSPGKEPTENLAKEKLQRRTSVTQVQCRRPSFDKKLNFLLVGKKAVGKSSTGNSILARKVFTPSNTFTVSNGQQCDVSIQIIDTPGLMDTDESQNVKTITQVLPNVMGECPEGFHAFILVLKYGEGFTEDQAKTLNILRCIFGKNIIKDHCIVILTNGESFDLEQTEADQPHSFRSWRSQQKDDLGRLFKECQDRAVLFHNLGKSPEMEKKRDESVRKLMHIAFELEKSNGRYTNEQFKLSAEERDKLTKTYREIQRKPVQTPNRIVRVQDNRPSPVMKRQATTYPDRMTKETRYSGATNVTTDTNPGTGTQLKCRQCSRQFHDRRTLDLHLRTIHKRKSLCTFCKTFFENRVDYFNHMKSYHPL